MAASPTAGLHVLVRHAAPAVAHVALIGDSHAAMWRATLAPIANDEGWHGVNIVHPGARSRR
jgi:hypothetical protein